MSRYLANPIDESLAGNLLAIFKEQRAAIIQQLSASCPHAPESLTGRERVAAGRILGLKTELEADSDPKQAMADGRIAVQLDPSLQTAPWSILARLQAEEGDVGLQTALECYSEAHTSDEWPDQQEAYFQAISAAPHFPWPYNNLAWHLATADDPAERDGKEAVRYATKACDIDGYHYLSFLDTLAAAHAENGSFDSATEYVNKAIAACPEDPSELEILAARYTSGQAATFSDPEDNEPPNHDSAIELSDFE